MTDKITMSLKQSQNKISLKEAAASIVYKNVGCIAKFKNRAILKFCNENGTKNCQMFISTVLNPKGNC